MRARWIVLGVMVWAATAHAEETAPAEDPLLASELRTARDAAAHGHCDIALRIGVRIRELDVAFYESRFAVDAPISACLNGTAPPPPRRVVTAYEDLSRERARPPMSPLRLGGELVLGTALGLGAAFGGWSLGFDLACNNDTECDLVVIALTLGATGLVLGSSVGVHVVGNAGDQNGSFGATIFGSAIGGLGSLALMTTMRDHSWSILALGPALGATWAFNMTRRYDRRASPSVVPTASTHAGVTTLGLAGTF